MARRYDTRTTIFSPEGRLYQASNFIFNKYFFCSFVLKSGNPIISSESALNFLWFLFLDHSIENFIFARYQTKLHLEIVFIHPLISFLLPG